jgi:hypothetical protein
MSCEASEAPPQVLSSGLPRVVHEFSDMDEMPISQGFLESIAKSAKRSRSLTRLRAPTSSRRAVATCRDAAKPSGYTFR